jgi:hypothetical protein
MVAVSGYGGSQMNLKLSVITVAAAALFASAAVAQTMQPIPNPPENQHPAKAHGHHGHGHHGHHGHHHHK